MDKPSYVYTLASRPYGTLYIGVTSDLIKRIWQHKEATVASFTKQYDIKHRVWYEIHTDITQAILREKQLKHWNRNWKINLAQSTNTTWRDLYPDICQ